MTLQGRRPADRRVRVERTRPIDYTVRPPRRIRRPPSPALVLVVGFAGLIAIGTVLLALPVSAEDGRWGDPLVALFTATSAVCVTGLVVVDTATHWSLFGEAVILLLVQIGGFGFMTGSTLLLLLLVGRRTSLSNRVAVQASTGVPDLGSVGAIVRRVGAFTLVVEAAGALVLGAAFLLRGHDPVSSAGLGVFHAVSAFNNAGFDLFGEFRSLTGQASDPLVLATIGVLIVLGALGFAIVGDVLAKRRWARLALETKVVVLTTLAVTVVGAVSIGLIEWGNPRTLGALPPEQRPLNALFEAITLRTAGFSSVPTGELRDGSLFVVMALMFIGGASGSTAGGIKVNTFSVLLIAILSSVRGRPSAEAFGRRIPHGVVYRALSVALLAIAFVFVTAFGLALMTAAPFLDVLFEAVSALATDGASTGLTPSLDAPARLVLVAAMYAGRLGPLTLVLALAARSRPVATRPAVESMRIG